jgi:hypothetical protein
MKSTYQMMNALVTLPPVGVSIKDGEGNTRKSASELRARICAVVPGWGSLIFVTYFPYQLCLASSRVPDTGKTMGSRRANYGS